MRHKFSRSEQEQDLKITMDNLYTFGFYDFTRNEVISEISMLVKPCFDIGLGDRLDGLRRLYKEMFSMTYADLTEYPFLLAEECERVLDAMDEEERPHEVEERFGQEVLPTLTMEEREDKPAMRLMFSCWLDNLVRNGELSDEIARECGQPIACW